MNNGNIKRGFKYEQGSVLTKRTIMTGDLQILLEYEDNLKASKDDFKIAVMEHNCLQKRTESNRRYTLNYLQNLYSLDLNNLIFLGMRSFLEKDRKSFPLIAGLTAFCRDSIYTDSFPFIKKLVFGEQSNKTDFEQFIENVYPGRFSEKMLQSLVRNLQSSWTQSGHLQGRNNKIRTEIEPTTAAVAYALFLGYLKGIRGQNLFLSEYITFLDCGYEKAIEYTETASMRGWLDLNKVGDVIEVRFPGIISDLELEGINE
ncbi:MULTISPECIES: hypothetical protein [unclassified Oceanispirochaeta]|uniref:hypothetical protein n=1 Tax=unclassified Oceanispirochaeta TaxID=2635722 RepID=UPI000E097CBA|nr:MULTISPECIES: hypothetical protein [unclassified Oceanispirochaeta]MBF9018895.1 hypothetical protein [Oceanispirochaeta sp. M2]NPD75394.1 hypothetical protein [Oceanispirochaeta sp. M1]RDG28757.1 hypothetical protein DV872_25195 [Oceanispirochaeta sp. M1]